VSTERPGLSGRTFPVILSAPSGGGKTSVARLLRERRGDIVFSISATTRPPRRYERDGRDYWFVSPEEFRRMADAGELVESAEVHGNLYGTPRRNLDEAVARGEYLLLDIDVQGARQIREEVPEAVHVFILPPSGEALVERLLRRGSEDDAVRRRRLASAREEMAAAAEFDYVVVNDDLEATVSAVDGILEAESRRAARLPGLAAAVRRLDGEIDRCLGSGDGS
jgi:guanylate kinase